MGGRERGWSVRDGDRKTKGERRLAARHDVLERAMESMLALIRFHIAECPDCASLVCSGGMADFIRRLDRDLLAAAEKVNREAGRQPRRLVARRSAPSR